MLIIRWEKIASNFIANCKWYEKEDHSMVMNGFEGFEVAKK
jgi:hypothetical protein